MKFAITQLSVVTVRAHSGHRSEQVTQLLFGDLVEILFQKGKSWTKIRCEWDNQIGWVQASQLIPVREEQATQYRDNFAYVLDLMAPVMTDVYTSPVTMGAKLRNFDGLRFESNDTFYSFSGQAVFPEQLRPTAALTVKLARRLLHAPYQWGGRSPLGVDAAGFTQLVFGMLNIPLPRFPNGQVHQGETVDFVVQSRAGDLAFFENKAGNIAHVGIILPDQQIIHASGQVRIDKIDHFGIFNDQTKKYTHRLRLVKRVLPIIEEATQPNIQKTTERYRQMSFF